MGRCECCKKRTIQKGITFHRFPTNDDERKKWTENLGKPDWVPAKTSVLCSEHSASDCFERWWNMRKLRKGSVPTIFQQDTSGAHKNSDADQVPSKKGKVDISTPLTKDPISFPPNHSSCVQIPSSAEAILYPMSPQISVKSISPSTPKYFTCRNQVTPVTPSTSHRKEIIRHDHRYLPIEHQKAVSYGKVLKQITNYNPEMHRNHDRIGCNS